MDYSAKIAEEMKTGLPYERLTRLFLEQWFDVRDATPLEDMNGKVDLVATRPNEKLLVQVKQPSKTGNVFIEHTAVNGQPGWGRTCDLLAKWLNSNKLLVVRLERVRQHWGDPSQFKTCYASAAKRQWYRRPGRQDLCREFTVDWFKQYANAKTFDVF